MTKTEVKKQKYIKPTQQLNNKALKIARKNSELLKKNLYKFD